MQGQGLLPFFFHFEQHHLQGKISQVVCQNEGLDKRKKEVKQRYVMVKFHAILMPIKFGYFYRKLPDNVWCCPVKHAQEAMSQLKS